MRKVKFQGRPVSHSIIIIVRCELTWLGDNGKLPIGRGAMTNLLTLSFEKASELPDDLQDQLAQELLDEIEWESCRDSTLEKSQDKLEKLAEKALREYRAGKTKEIGFDDLCEIPTQRRLYLLFSRIRSLIP